MPGKEGLGGDGGVPPPPAVSVGGTGTGLEPNEVKAFYAAQVDYGDGPPATADGEWWESIFVLCLCVCVCLF